MVLSEVRSLCRLTLADAAAWPDATLDRWIGVAIGLYSAHFPRRWRSTIALEAGVQWYDAPGDVSLVAILSVECPAGRSPARFLRPVAEASADFQRGAGVYAVRGVAEDDGSGSPSLAVGAANSVGDIVFAEAVADGETAVVEYLGAHRVPAVGDDDAVVTVPAAHVEAISAFVEYATLFELETGEAVAADGSSILLSMLGEQARRAWNRYKEVLDRLVWLAGAPVGVAPVSWGDYGL